MKKLLSAAIAATILGLSSGAASATTISVDTSASGIFGTIGGARVSYTDTTLGNGSTFAGMFHLKGTGGLGEFVAFCVELTQRLQNPQDYDVNPALFSASKTADISKLFGSALNGGGTMETVSTPSPRRPGSRWPSGKSSMKLGLPTTWPAGRSRPPVPVQTQA